MDRKKSLTAQEKQQTISSQDMLSPDPLDSTPDHGIVVIIEFSLMNQITLHSWN